MNTATIVILIILSVIYIIFGIWMLCYAFLNEFHPVSNIYRTCFIISEFTGWMFIVCAVLLWMPIEIISYMYEFIDDSIWELSQNKTVNEIRARRVQKKLARFLSRYEMEVKETDCSQSKVPEEKDIVKKAYDKVELGYDDDKWVIHMSDTSSTDTISIDGAKNLMKTGTASYYKDHYYTEIKCVENTDATSNRSGLSLIQEKLKGKMIKVSMYDPVFKKEVLTSRLTGEKFVMFTCTDANYIYTDGCENIIINGKTIANGVLSVPFANAEQLAHEGKVTYNNGNNITVTIEIVQ